MITMTTCARPLSFVLTHAAFFMHSKDLTPSLCCFIPKPQFGAFSSWSRVLNPKGRTLSKWVDVNSWREAKSWPYDAALGALSAWDGEVVDNVEEKDDEVEGDDESMSDTIATPKAQKRKAVFPIKKEKGLVTSPGYPVWRFLPCYGGKRVILLKGTIKSMKMATITTGGKLEEACYKVASIEEIMWPRGLMPSPEASNLMPNIPGHSRFKQTWVSKSRTQTWVWH